MIQAILFDLDDTLYIEAQFFRSGFNAVSAMVAGRVAGCSASAVCAALEAIHFGQGRENVFDKALDRLGLPAELLSEMVTTFRAHTPTIVLAPDVIPVLPRLRARYKIGCVTDGWSDVQRRKIKTLGVEKLVDAIVVADELGRDRWKPHPEPFLRCCAMLGVAPSQAVYVGDNPARDLVGAEAAGLGFVLIHRDDAYPWEWPQSLASRIVPHITSLTELEALLQDRAVHLDTTNTPDAHER